jgi:MoxR-like ATPase
MALYRATQARAFLAGRDFALPDDVKALVPAVLGHRVLLDIDRELRGSTVEGVIEAVLGSVAAPPVRGATAQNPA